MPEPQDLHRRVDEFLRQALEEADPSARASLLGKAVYWNKVALQAGGPQRPLFDPWKARSS